MKRPRLLFTGGGGAASMPLNQLLSSEYDCYFADCAYFPTPIGLREDQKVLIPHAASLNFTSELLKRTSELNIDLVIPGVDEELVAVSALRDSGRLSAICPDSVFIAAHLDKYLSYSLLADVGIDVPRFALLSEENWEFFPCIVKPRLGRGSRNITKINNLEELKTFRQLAKMAHEDFVIQPYLSGQEYSVTMVADKTGLILAVVPVLIIKKQGITLIGQTTKDADVIKYCQLLHKSNPTQGIYNVQLIKNSAQACGLLEINPRVSTTACLALASGVPIIDFFLKRPSLLPSTLAHFEQDVRLERSWFTNIGAS